MKVKIEWNVKTICFIAIIVICILALSYGVYSQVFVKPNAGLEEKFPEEEAPNFDELFDNKIHLQDYSSANYVQKIESTKDLVYTTYTLNEIFEGKYEIQVSVPLLNINNENAINIDKEILSVFYNKINNIIASSTEEDSPKVIYTVSYTAYLNQNILSLAIKATLKEGNSNQRVIIQSYTYNISTNQQVSLNEMLNIKAVSKASAESKINTTIENAIAYSDNLSSLGYDSFKRNKDDSMYTIENSNNYFLGPDENLYIIYAYGNTNLTTERDIVFIK